MDFKIITFPFVLLAFSNNVTAENSKKYSAKEYFKNYALSACISDGFEAKEIHSDAAAAARGYLELGEYPLEAHTEATLLGREFLEKEYKSHTGESLTLMKCIDFYHSNELENITAKYETK